MNTFSRIALPTVALLACSASGLAQDLDGEVVRNPDETVTYTLDLDGPPRGQSFVLTSTFPLFAPLRTPFGPLFLDPAATFVVGQSAIDPAGQGSLCFTFPAVPVQGVPFYFQSFSIDLSNQLALSPTYLRFLTQDLAFHSALPPNFGLVVKGQAGTDAVGARFRLVGSAGTVYRITVTDAAGQPVAQRQVRISTANGNVEHVEFGPQAGLRRDHRWRIDELTAAGPAHRASGSFD